MGFVWYGGLGVGGGVCMCMCMGWRDVARGWDIKGVVRERLGGGCEGFEWKGEGRGGGRRGWGG